MYKFLKLKSVHIKLYLALRWILYAYPGLIHHYSINIIKCFTKFKSLAPQRHMLLKWPSQSTTPISYECAFTTAVLTAVREGMVRMCCGVHVLRGQYRAGSLPPHLYLDGFGDSFKGCQPLQTSDFYQLCHFTDQIVYFATINLYIKVLRNQEATVPHLCS